VIRAVATAAGEAIAGAVPVAAPRPRPRQMAWPIRTPSLSWLVVMVSRQAQVKVKVRVAGKAAVLAVVRDPGRALARVPVVQVLGWVLALEVPVFRWVVRRRPDSRRPRRAPA
jgi:hypothetical protein